jgi:hypothetical protein
VDRFSMVKAIVTMVADYVRMPTEEQQAKRDGTQGRALQIVKGRLRSAGSRATTLIEAFEEDPDTYDDAIAKYLLQQISQDTTLAVELGDLLSQFHRERASGQQFTVWGEQTAPSSSGLAIRKGSVVMGGDVKGVDISKSGD